MIVKHWLLRWPGLLKPRASPPARYGAHYLVSSISVNSLMIDVNFSPFLLLGGTGRVRIIVTHMLLRWPGLLETACFSTSSWWSYHVCMEHVVCVWIWLLLSQMCSNYVMRGYHMRRYVCVALPVSVCVE